MPHLINDREIYTSVSISYVYPIDNSMRELIPLCHLCGRCHMEKNAYHG
jgi:hypothetical protein